MLKAIITYLNLKLDLLNYFDLTRCLVELKESETDNGTLKQPVEYISNGEFDVINFDEFNGVSYWRLRDEPTTERTETQKYRAGAKNNIETTIPLRLVFAVPRAKLTEDDAYSFDRIRQTMVKQFAIDDEALKNQLGAISVRITQVGSNSKAKEVWEEETEGTGTFEPKYETVFGSIDVDVVIVSDHECLPTECDDVESDILRAFDWCGNTAVTVGRLTQAQQDCISDYICGVADPVQIQINGVNTETAEAGTTYDQEIHNSAGADVGTAANPSVVGDTTVTINGESLGATGSVVAEGSLDIPVNLDGSPAGSWDGDSWEVTSAPCADVEIEINGSNLTSVASGGTHNQEIENSAGTPVGTVANPSVVGDSSIGINGVNFVDLAAEANLNIPVHDTDDNDVGTINGSEVEIADSTVENSDQSYQVSVLAEGTLVLPDIQFTDSDGSTSSVPSVQDIVATPCPSVSVVISDTTPDFGDAVTITATAADITPTSYRFHIPDSSGKYNVIEQASNVYNWTVGFTGTFDVYVEAENATDGICEVGGVSVTSSAGGVLNQYTGARCGFSCQSISSYSSFPIMTIRRSSDNAQSNFYPNLNNKLGMDSKNSQGVTLASWIGANSGYVVRWFHQGNEFYYAYQETAASQPRIVNAGTLEVVNGEPALYFDGTNDFLNTNTGTVAQPLTYFVVAKRDSGSLGITIMSLVSGTIIGGRDQIYQASSAFQIFAETAGISSGATTTNQLLHTALFDGASSEYWNDGSSVATGNPGTATLQNNLEIGGQRGGLFVWHGHIQEVILYPSDQSANRVAIETNINDRYSIY